MVNRKCHICGEKLKKNGRDLDIFTLTDYQKYKCPKCNIESIVKCVIINGRLVEIDEVKKDD